jgi:5-methyltetrahydrofolate--homocysteine methyltransferase
VELLKELVKNGDAEETAERVRELLAGGTNPEAIMKEALIPAMDEVGDLFQRGEAFVPEMLIAARAMQSGLDVLKPELAESGVEPLGKVIVGTVKGDLHDIGKNLVVMVLEGAGFEVVDLGVDVSPEQFVEAIKEHSPQIVGLSALLTTTMLAMRDTIDAVKEAGLREQVKVMVGGAPMRQEYADEIGADFYGPDSTAARNYAKEAV